MSRAYNAQEETHPLDGHRTVHGRDLLQPNLIVKSSTFISYWYFILSCAYNAQEEIHPLDGHRTMHREVLLRVQTESQTTTRVQRSGASPLRRTPTSV